MDFLRASSQLYAARAQFVTAMTVPLHDWALLEDATEWAYFMAAGGRGKFARRTDYVQKTAEFDFENDVMACQFALLF